MALKIIAPYIPTVRRKGYNLHENYPITQYTYVTFKYWTNKRWLLVKHSNK